MAKPSAVESNRLDHKHGLLDGQQAEAFGVRVRERANDLGLKPAAIGRLSGISKQSMTGYFAGQRLPGSDKLFALADALECDARWLVTGIGPSRGSALVEAGNADWVEIPEYDLQAISDEGMGAPVISVPVRRDWLNSTFRTASGLWLARLLSAYPSAELQEGMLAICRTMRPEDLTEGHVCLWRVAERVVPGRFSVVPDDRLARGIVEGVSDRLGGALSAYLDPSSAAPGSDIVVPPSAIAAGRFHLIGRILGVMIRPL